LWRSSFFLKCISVLIYGIFLKLHITYRNGIWYSRCMFGCDQSLMQDTLPEKQATSWWCLGFRWRDFPYNSHLSLYVNLLITVCGCLPTIRIKVCHLNSCVTGRLCLGCICRNCSDLAVTICAYCVEACLPLRKQ